MVAGAMRWILLGPPGSGKGTQAKKLAGRHNLAHLSTGDILRAEVAAGTELGRKAKSHMDRGDLVPDQLILDMIRERLARLDDGGGFILDGFARTTAHADGLNRMLDEMSTLIDRAVLVEVSDTEIQRRLTGRARFEGRGDDTEQIIAHRLDVYRKQTEPLIRYYEQRGLLSRLDGERSVEAVFGELEKLAAAQGVS